MTTCNGGGGGGDCHGCCDNKNNKHDDSVLCLAVVRENGADVVLFDATGTPRSFTYSGGDAGKLCFSTHGNVQVADLLSPCFDEDGKHGVPNECCFCGVDTPHLHAHLHDPRTCHEEASKTSKQDESDLSRLAQLILHPTHIDKEFTPEETERVMTLSISEQLPNQCNSKELLRHMSERGLTHSKSTRRMHKIRHADHVDYLVHDVTTDDLHLEHPCDTCGDNDVHGKFRLVGKRRLQGNDRMQLHFFEVAQKPFRILDYITGLFEFDLNADRVLAARPTCTHDHDHGHEHSHGHSHGHLHACKHTFVPPKKKPCCQAGTCSAATSIADDICTILPGDGNSVRSSFMCKGICCASEIPMINKVLEPVLGVQKILINVPVKMVIIDHDPDVVSAKNIEAILNKNHFGAQIKTAGAGTLATGSTCGRSQFFVQKICCASEIPAINTIVEPIPGVSKVSINVTTKMVYVDHDTASVSATDICDALNADHFGAHIRRDAAHDVRAPLSAFVSSTLSFTSSDTTSPDTQNLKEFLGTFDPMQMEAFVVDVPLKKIKVVHNPHILSAETIVKKLAEDTGIKAIIIVNGAQSANWEFPEVREEQETTEKHESRPRIPTILSGVFWVISMLSLIGGNWEYLKYVALLAVAFGLPSIGIKAFRTLQRLQCDTNVLMFTATVGALALQDFTEAGAVVFLFSISEWLEVRATSRARNALYEIIHLRPDKANLIHPFTKTVMLVPASAVPVGALVSVRTGDKIPCDGVVVEGNSTVDESSLTGESRSVRKGPNDVVSGGTINVGITQLVVLTTSTAENSAVARLIRLVEEAQANRSPTEKLVDEFAKRYTPIVILAAILMCSIPWAYGHKIGREWMKNGLVLIVIACPCALIISTPVTYVAALAATAQRGILIKGGAHLEALGMVKKIAFDKTGTLTQGEFTLLHLITFSDHYTREEVIQRLALMEERASHPLAHAIVQAAQNENISVPKGMTANNHTQLLGEGVTAVVNGKTVHVGNERLFRRLGLFEELPQEQKQSAEEWASLGGTVGFMSIEGSGIICSYCVADAVRPESAEVVRALSDLGIDVTMLTGDNRSAALAIGQQVGLSEEHILSELLPEDKLISVSGMKEERRSNTLFGNSCRRQNLVLMCGDGVNDAPALATADVGVAMGAGAALAMETSDVTLLDSKLDKLVYSIRMGRRVILKIRENVIFSVAVKAIVFGFALSGDVYLWAAIASDVGAMLIVTLNGMMLLPSRKKDIQLVKKQGEGNEGTEQVLESHHSTDGTMVADNVPVVNAPCCAHGECRSRILVVKNRSHVEHAPNYTNTSEHSHDQHHSGGCGHSHDDHHHSGGCGHHHEQAVAHDRSAHGGSVPCCAHGECRSRNIKNRFHVEHAPNYTNTNEHSHDQHHSGGCGHSHTDHHHSGGCGHHHEQAVAHDRSDHGGSDPCCAHGECRNRKVKNCSHVEHAPNDTNTSEHSQGHHDSGGCGHHHE